MEQKIVAQKEQALEAEVALWKSRFDGAHKKGGEERSALIASFEQLQKELLERVEAHKDLALFHEQLKEDLAASERRAREAEKFAASKSLALGQLETEKAKIEALIEEQRERRLLFYKESNRMRVQLYQAKILLKTRMALPAQTERLSRSFIAPRAKAKVL